MFFDVSMSSNMPIILKGYDTGRVGDFLSRILGEIEHNIIFVKKKRSSYGVEDINIFKQQLLVKRGLGDLVNCYVLNEADNFTVQAQNAMLTLLEALPCKVLIVFLVDSEDSLLPTIRSRCLILGEGASGVGSKIDLSTFFDLKKSFFHIMKIEEKRVVLEEIRYLLNLIQEVVRQRQVMEGVCLSREILRAFHALSNSNISYRTVYEYVAILIYKHRYIFK